MRVLAFVSGAHPVHVAWFRSVGATILPTLVGHKILASFNIAFGAVLPKLVALMFLLSKSCIKVFEKPVVEVLARRSLLALGEGGGTLDYLKVAKDANPDVKTLLVSGDPIFYKLAMGKKIHYYRSMLRYVDYVIATSHYVRNLASKFIDSSRVKVVYPYPLHGCSPNEVDAEKHVASRGNVVLAYVGELSKLKGFDILLEAFKILVGKYNVNARLLIAGRGPLVKLLSKYLKLYRDKIVYCGYVNPKPIYKVAQLYVHPARFDAFSISVVEAITCGCVPVISRSTGAIDFLENTKVKSLLVLGKEDPEELAHMIADIVLVRREHMLDELKMIRKLVYMKANMYRSIQGFVKTIKDIICYEHQIKTLCIA